MADTELLVGTSGFSYKEWKGPFYPPDLAAQGMLGFFAERLPSVEINNTFYRMPRASVLEGWARSVPERFRFAVKASRRITHQKRLANVDEEVGYLSSALRALGPKLGTVLFQLPPFLKKDVERLDRFLGAWPRELPAAVEFRNPSWDDPKVLDCLRAHGAARALVDDDDAPEPVATAGDGYFRLRRPGYSREELSAWATRIAGLRLERAFVFFKHEDAGAGPRLAAEFLELASPALQDAG